jgi:hypothetical protein
MTFRIQGLRLMEHYCQKFKLEPLGRTILILPPKKRPSGDAESIAASQSQTPIAKESSMGKKPGSQLTDYAGEGDSRPEFECDTSAGPCPRASR